MWNCAKPLPITITITTINLTQILQLCTLAQALLVKIILYIGVSRPRPSQATLDERKGDT